MQCTLSRAVAGAHVARRAISVQAGRQVRFSRVREIQSLAGLLNPAQGRIPEGFKRWEYGLQWHANKEELYAANPRPVLLGTSYEFFADSGTGGPIKQARKYSSVETYEAFWELICKYRKFKKPQNLHEVLTADKPRCLYFDIDGSMHCREMHETIIKFLCITVRWFFGGESLGWEDDDPVPVVLMSSDPSKYSCHVIFPQIQMANFQEQRQYISMLLNSLPALLVHQEDGKSVPLLEQVVDRVPYMPFQLLRGPFACKLKDGELRYETCLVPQEYFRGDPLTSFAGYVEPYYALQLPPALELLSQNEELRNLHQEHTKRITNASGAAHGCPSPQDDANLFCFEFQQPRCGSIDFAGLPEVEIYEIALRLLNPDRASQWWSWFRMSGVAYHMLQRYCHDEGAQERIWNAHLAWSQTYPGFDESENIEQVMRCEGRRVSGLRLLENLVRFDNPNMEVRSSTWQDIGRRWRKPVVAPHSAWAAAEIAPPLQMAL